MGQQHYDNLSADRQNLVNARIEQQLFSMTIRGERAPVAEAYGAALSRMNQITTQQHLNEYYSENPEATRYSQPRAIPQLPTEQTALLRNYIDEQRVVLSAPEKIAQLEADSLRGLSQAIVYSRESHNMLSLDSGFGNEMRSRTVNIPARSEDEVRTDRTRFLFQITERMDEYRVVNDKQDGRNGAHPNEHDGTNPNASLPNARSGTGVSIP